LISFFKKKGNQSKILAMELSEEQKLAFEKYKHGKNLFLTGPGGSGKSALIRYIHQDAIRNKKKIQVCALTGCAALLLGCKAKTVHSWAGIGLGNGKVEHIVAKVKANNFAKKAWSKTDILVIDEVSMLSLKLFKVLNTIGKEIRKSRSPFGGIQLIFSGDFYQLPPVGNREDPDTMAFCFESEEWNHVFDSDCQIQFTTLFRQSGDSIYSKILNEIRIGKMKRKSVEILEKHVNRKVDEELIVEPTKLYPTKSKVDTINTTKMCELDEEEQTFLIRDELGIYSATTVTDSESDEISYNTTITNEMIRAELTYLKANLICEKELKLKKGCQVMCIVNIVKDDRTILVCNGSQGIVTGFTEITKTPIVRFNNGVEREMLRHTWPSEKFPSIGVSQIPLTLAWALTIHKSQGATMDAAEIDVGSSVFECGQTYVALSRVKSLEGLYLTSFDVTKIKINKKVQDFYKGLTIIEPKEKEPKEKEPKEKEPKEKENPFSVFQYLEKEL
jgi:ATP-dependent DNA helicase PIF1